MHKQASIPHLAFLFCKAAATMPAAQEHLAAGVQRALTPPGNIHTGGVPAPKVPFSASMGNLAQPDRIAPAKPPAWMQLLQAAPNNLNVPPVAPLDASNWEQQSPAISAGVMRMLRASPVWSQRFNQ